MCQRTKTKPSVTAIRQMAAGLCGARQRSTLVDQLGLTSTTTSGTRWLSLFFQSLRSLHCCHLTLSFTLSLSCLHILLILSVNPTLSLSLSLCPSHYSKHVLPISPSHNIPKQGQSCNPFTAPLSTDCTQIILKDLQTGLGSVRGKGRNRHTRGERVRAIERGRRKRGA